MRKKEAIIFLVFISTLFTSLVLGADYVDSPYSYTSILVPSDGMITINTAHILDINFKGSPYAPY